jgi:hypothetical protein
MDKLTKVYLDLATNPTKFEAFNHGKDCIEKQKSRKQFLIDAGIDDCEEIIMLSEQELQELLSKKLSTQQKSWENIEQQVGNIDNTDNRVSKLGRTANQ